MAHRAAEGRAEWSRRDRSTGGEWPGSSATGPPKGEQSSGSHPRPLERLHHDRAPVTPPAAAPHVEAAVLTLVAGATTVVVGSAGHLATGSAVHLQRLQQVEFNECEAMVVGHDGFTVQVCVTKGPPTTYTRTGNSHKESECRSNGEANNKHAPPATALAQAPAGEGRPTSGPTHQRTGASRGHARHNARELEPGARSAAPWGHNRGNKAGIQAAQCQATPRQKHAPQGEG